MKAPKYKFQWFESEDRRRVLRATMSPDRKLRLGEELRKKLPEDILVGFDTDSRTLAIASGHGSGIPLPKNGVLNMAAMCRQIARIGMELPLVFEFERDPATGFYLGHIVPLRQLSADDTARAEQIALIYRPVVEQVVDQLAKSTPRAERRAIAVAALCEAAQAYRPGLGDFSTYLDKFLRQRLLEENRKYVENFRQFRLDAPLRPGHASSPTHADLLTDRDSGGIAGAEDRVMAQQFRASLDCREQQLLELMEQEIKLTQIALEMEMTRDEVLELGRSIGRKREEFYQSA